MRAGSFHRPTGVMSKSNQAAIEALPLKKRERKELPACVEPEAGEAIISWLWRLARRLELSVEELGIYAFMIDTRSARTHWWRRPDPWLLERMSERTGISRPKVRQMTFLSWAPDYRDDSLDARFTGRYFDRQGVTRRSDRFAVCRQCLVADREPYLRALWTVSWVSICPQHATILTVRCPRCRTGLRLSPLVSKTSGSLHLCRHCGSDLRNEEDEFLAEPLVERLQSTLIAAKRGGQSHWNRFGVLSWAEMVALIDVLMGTFWKGLSWDERCQIYPKYEQQIERLHGEESSPYDSNYGALRLLTWLTEDWPDGAGAEVGQLLLRRHFTRELQIARRRECTRGSAARGSEVRDFPIEIQARLQDIAAVAGSSARVRVLSRPKYSIHD